MAKKMRMRMRMRKKMRRVKKISPIKKRKTMTSKSFHGEIFEAEKRKMIVLESSDGVIFEVEEEVAAQSRVLQFMIEDNCAYNGTLPVPNVTGDILDMVIEYCWHHAKVYDPDPGKSDSKPDFSPEDLGDFDEELLDIDWDTLMLLIQAANYLDVPDLVTLGCREIVDRTSRQSIEQVREIFNIKNDFTPEEEAELRRKHPWAFGIHAISCD